jgi:hypothetical protein
MANAKSKAHSKKESLEELQQKRTNKYFALGDKTYHIKVLETDVINLSQEISILNKTISDMLKAKEKEDALKKTKDFTQDTDQPAHA